MWCGNTVWTNCEFCFRILALSSHSVVRRIGKELYFDNVCYSNSLNSSSLVKQISISIKTYPTLLLCSRKFCCACILVVLLDFAKKLQEAQWTQAKKIFEPLSWVWWLLCCWSVGASSCRQGTTGSAIKSRYNQWTANRLDLGLTLVINDLDGDSDKSDKTYCLCHPLSNRCSSRWKWYNDNMWKNPFIIS